jgi:hypothetical protein
MYEDRRISVLQTVCTCDRCGLEMRQETYDGEWEERLAVVFRAGYHSLFGDGNLVELDLCQHCVKDVLGQWLRVTVVEPFQPVVKPQHEARRAYQDYQLKEMLRPRVSLFSSFGLPENWQKDADAG